MLEIPLVHGSVWINPYYAISVEASSVGGGAIEGSFITMHNGSGWNTPLKPAELARRIAAYKQQFDR